MVQKSPLPEEHGAELQSPSVGARGISEGSTGIEISPPIGLLAPVNNPTVMKSSLVLFQVKWEMKKVHFLQQPSGVLCQPLLSPSSPFFMGSHKLSVELIP